jgi:hypothetical protein
MKIKLTLFSTFKNGDINNRGSFISIKLTSAKDELGEVLSSELGSTFIKSVLS